MGIKTSLRFYGSIALIIGLVLLIALLGIPILILRNLLKNARIDFTLSMSNFNLWSTFGSSGNGSGLGSTSNILKGVTNEKVFEFFEVESDRYKRLTSLRLKQNYQFMFLKQSSFSDAVIKDQKITAKQADTFTIDADEDMKSYAEKKINTVRPGVLKGVDFLEKRPKSDLFVILLTALFQDLTDPRGSKGGILVNYFTSKIFYQDITYDTVKTALEYAGITDITTINNMWFDESYGFKNIQTFNVYLRINFLGKTNIRTYLKNYFKITEEQMEKVTGNTDPNSLIHKKRMEYTTALNDAFKVDCDTDECSQTEYAMIQWGNRGVTKDVNKIEYVKSYLDLNSSILFPYEVNSYKEDVTFSLKEVKKLLDMEEGGGQSKNLDSLLNFENAAFLANNLDTPAKITQRFNLDSDAKAETLISYYKGTMKTFGTYTKTPKEDYYRARFSRDAINMSIDLLQRYTLNNISMKAFSDEYKKNKNQYRCRDYFNTFKEAICNSNTISLDTYAGITTWVIALQLDLKQRDPGEWDAREYILKELGQDKMPNAWEDILKSTLFIEKMNEIQGNFLEKFGCFKPGPCARKFLAEKQWYEGYCTNQPDIYPSLNVPTVAAYPENKILLKNKIPEIYGFYYIHYGFKGIVFGGEEDIIFSNNAGSILNYYQLMVVADFSLKGRTSDLAHLFNIWSPPEYFVDYIDHLFFEWYFDGLIEDQTPIDLLMGYNDKKLEELKTVPDLFGGFLDIDPWVSYNVLKTKSYNVNFNAGSASQEVYKERSWLNSVDNSEFIMFNNTDAWNEQVPIHGSLKYHSQPLNYQTGGFIYHDSMKRNLNFKMSKIAIDSQFSVNNLIWDSENLKANKKVYNTEIDGVNNMKKFAKFSLMTSLAYFDEAPEIRKFSGNSLTLNSKPFNNQTMKAKPHMNVERFSGFVFEYFVPIQYSIVIKKAGFFSHLLKEDFYIPIFIETENFYYTQKGKINTFNSIQKKLLDKNLFEYYGIILAVVFFAIGGVMCSLSKRVKKNDFGRKSIKFQSVEAANQVERDNL